MRNILKKQYGLILGIVLLVVLLQGVLSLTSLFSNLEMMTYDIRAKIAIDDGPFSNLFKHADKKIVIVAIDDYSRKEIAKYPYLGLGSFPWDRDVWAKVVNYIEQGEPKAILFDIIFNELNSNPNNDRTFARELRNYNNVVLATSLNDPEYMVKRVKKIDIPNSNYLPTNKGLDVAINDKVLDSNITYYSHAPIHDMYTNYNMMGVVNKVVGVDSVIRNSQPLFKLNKDGETFYLPSLSFAGFLKYIGEDGTLTIKDNEIHYKDRVIPINHNGEMIIGWHGRGKDYDYVPISKIFLSRTGLIENPVKPNYFKDKIVIIGRSEAGTDIHAAAVNPSYAGPESNAAVIDNLINDTQVNAKHTRKILTKMDFSTAMVMVVLSCAFIAFVGMVSRNALLGFANTVAIILLFLLITIWAYSAPSIRIWIPIALPLYYFIMTGLIVFAFRFQKELAKKATIMNMFGKFVSPKTLATLMKHQDDLQLRTSKKRVTVMFCDVKSFTTLSEKSNPEDLVRDLNEMFDVIVDVIFKNNGTIDKFIGDCIMAYWGDPIADADDAYMAVKTALEIKKRVAELGIKNAKEGKIVLDVKLGINTGDALLGLSGSHKLMSYTAMGDAVNVAARLESNCNKLGKDILISKSTYEDAKEKIVVMEVDTISVKGRAEQIQVYEPIGLKEDVNSSNDVENA